MEAILITGPVASGKTVVAQEIVTIAEERGTAVAAVDLDWLGWVTGANVSYDEMIGRNLESVAANYVEAGVTRLVASRALVRRSGLDAIEKALAGWELVVVELHAARATLESRLRGRDVGRELEHNLHHLAEPFESLPGAHRVRSEGRELRDIAAEVLRVAGWI